MEQSWSVFAVCPATRIRPQSYDLRAQARLAGLGVSSWPWTTLDRLRLSCALSHRPVLMGFRLPVTRTSKLGVTGTQTEHMPFYLRVFFRVLSS